MLICFQVFFQDSWMNRKFKITIYLKKKPSVTSYMYLLFDLFSVSLLNKYNSINITVLSLVVNMQAHFCHRVKNKSEKLVTWINITFLFVFLEFKIHRSKPIVVSHSCVCLVNVCFPSIPIAGSLSSFTVSIVCTRAQDSFHRNDVVRKGI